MGFVPHAFPNFFLFFCYILFFLFLSLPDDGQTSLYPLPSFSPFSHVKVREHIINHGICFSAIKVNFFLLYYYTVLSYTIIKNALSFFFKKCNVRPIFLVTSLSYLSTAFSTPSLFSSFSTLFPQVFFFSVLALKLSLL